MKNALRQGGPNALNLCSTTAGAYLGWAYLPDIVTKPGQAHLDGVVIDWESIPGTSTTYADRFDEGKTATHEVGHWLDLEHTFYGGCSAKGDFVDDTPPQKTPTSGCPEGKDTCSAPGLDPIHNHMDYSYDSCYGVHTRPDARDERRLAAVPSAAVAVTRSDGPHREGGCSRPRATASDSDLAWASAVLWPVPSSTSARRRA